MESLAGPSTPRTMNIDITPRPTYDLPIRSFLQAYSHPAFILDAQALFECLVQRLSIWREYDPEEAIHVREGTSIGGKYFSPNDVDDGIESRPSTPSRSTRTIGSAAVLEGPDNWQDPSKINADRVLSSAFSLGTQPTSPHQGHQHRSQGQMPPQGIVMDSLIPPLAEGKRLAGYYPYITGKPADDCALRPPPLHELFLL